MKRVSLVFLSLTLVFLCVGCGSKSLNCSKTSGDQTMEYKLKFDKDEKIKSGTITMTQKYNKDEVDEDEIDDFIAEMKEEAKENGMKLKAKKGKEKVTFTINFDADKVNEALGSSFEDDSTFDEIKDELEDSNFKCKK